VLCENRQGTGRRVKGLELPGAKLQKVQRWVWKSFSHRGRADPRRLTCKACLRAQKVLDVVRVAGGVVTAARRGATRSMQMSPGSAKGCVGLDSLTWTKGRRRRRREVAGAWAATACCGHGIDIKCNRGKKEPTKTRGMSRRSRRSP
jgi:hypothetical protein